MSKKIFVLGANGFIGMEICLQALTQGHTVIGMARRGRPENVEPWTNSMQWLAADVFHPETWSSHLEGCDAIIHCIGILREKPQAGITYERFFFETTRLAAQIAELARVSKFVLLSAQNKPPFISNNYLIAKHRAETLLAGHTFESAILRPSLVYGTKRPASLHMKRILKAGMIIPPFRYVLSNQRPLSVRQVAITALRAATEPQIKGLLTIDLIEQLSQTRRSTALLR